MRRTVPPTHPFSLATLFVVMGLRDLIPFVTLAEFGTALAAMLGLAGVLTVIARWVTRDRAKCSLLASLGIVYLLFFSDLYAVSQSVLPFRMSSARYFLVALSVLVGGAAVWIVLTRRDLGRLGRFLDACSIACVVGLLCLFGIDRARARASAPPARPELATLALHTGTNRPPDIYYLIFDSYTSSESLRKFWDHDNSPFQNALGRMGFQVVERSRGNANSTLLSLSTSLNLAHPPPPPTNWSPHARHRYYLELIQDPAVVRTLEAAGYETHNLSLFDLNRHPRAYDSPWHYYNNFVSFLMAKTPYGHVENHFRVRRLADVSLGLLGRVRAIAEQPSPKPRFVYLHVMLPHAPYFFDRHGNRVNRGLGPSANSTDGKDDYLEQLIYTNHLITNTVDALLHAATQSPIVVVQGDHGFRYLTGAARREEAYSILNAYHLPGASTDCVYPGITPVNTFRLIFRHYFGLQGPYEPDLEMPDPVMPCD